MSSIIEELEQQILRLNQDQKEAILRTLLADFDGPLDSDARSRWLDLALRRKHEIESGSVTPVAAEDAYARVRVRLRQ